MRFVLHKTIFNCPPIYGAGKKQTLLIESEMENINRR